MVVRDRVGASGSEGESEEEEEEEFDDGYGPDLKGDEKDRETLAKMSEMNREAILTERQNKRDAWKQK